MTTGKTRKEIHQDTSTAKMSSKNNPHRGEIVGHHSDVSLCISNTLTKISVNIEGYLRVTSS